MKLALGAAQRVNLIEEKDRVLQAGFAEQQSEPALEIRRRGVGRARQIGRQQ